ncbi:type II toxin-antitoxin system VapC family toxin [Candidatus Methylocalor cossyra]|uniref:Ribonuclease VapC n=1 Tax=Candidatus Methylocalor cossyra TaxID=3108543 RepID=A0ABP1CCE8_9GAMM
MAALPPQLSTSRLPTRVLVDSNVIIDITSDDPQWFDWSAAWLRALKRSRLLINPLILAEVGVLAESAEEVEELEARLGLERMQLPWEAAFLAGRAFVAYRRAGGKRSAPLPDFYIGAHAQVTGLTLLTRDARRYRSYFPDLRLIAPDTTP